MIDNLVLEYRENEINFGISPDDISTDPLCLTREADGLYTKCGTSEMSLVAAYSPDEPLLILPDHQLADD